MNLTFDADSHSYHLDGKPVPHVTGIINRVCPGWQAADWYLQRGRALHEGARLLDAGQLDWSTVHPEIFNRLEAWQKFREQWPAEVEASEIPLASERYRFAGTLDRVFRFNGNTARPAGEWVLCDLKSTIAPQVRIQLGFYALLWNAAVRKGAALTRACAVELRDDGTYRCLWLNKDELRRAEQVAMACLTVYNFMAEHKVTTNAQ